MPDTNAWANGFINPAMPHLHVRASAITLLALLVSGCIGAAGTDGPGSPPSEGPLPAQAVGVWPSCTYDNGTAPCEEAFASWVQAHSVDIAIDPTDDRFVVAVGVTPVPAPGGEAPATNSLVGWVSANHGADWDPIRLPSVGPDLDLLRQRPANIHVNPRVAFDAAGGLHVAIGVRLVWPNAESRATFHATSANHGQTWSPLAFVLRDDAGLTLAADERVILIASEFGGLAVLDRDRNEWARRFSPTNGTPECELVRPILWQGQVLAPCEVRATTPGTVSVNDVRALAINALDVRNGTYTALHEVGAASCYGPTLLATSHGFLLRASCMEPGQRLLVPAYPARQWLVRGNTTTSLPFPQPLDGYEPTRSIQTQAWSPDSRGIVHEIDLVTRLGPGGVAFGQLEYIAWDPVTGAALATRVLASEPNGLAEPTGAGLLVVASPFDLVGLAHMRLAPRTSLAVDDAWVFVSGEMGGSGAMARYQTGPAPSPAP